MPENFLRHSEQFHCFNRCYQTTLFSHLGNFSLILEIKLEVFSSINPLSPVRQSYWPLCPGGAIFSLSADAILSLCFSLCFLFST
jgi:hypothetical protein